MCGNVNILAEESWGYHKILWDKPCFDEECFGLV